MLIVGGGYIYMVFAMQFFQFLYLEFFKIKCSDCPEFKSSLCHIPAVWFKAYCIILNLSLHIEIGAMVSFPHRVM